MFRRPVMRRRGIGLLGAIVVAGGAYQLQLVCLDSHCLVAFKGVHEPLMQGQHSLARQGLCGIAGEDRLSHGLDDGLQLARNEGSEKAQVGWKLCVDACLDVAGRDRLGGEHLGDSLLDLRLGEHVVDTLAKVGAIEDR
jgi:hypothetical protein